MLFREISMKYLIIIVFTALASATGLITSETEDIPIEYIDFPPMHINP
jgi:hypothetical protein